MTDTKEVRARPSAIVFRDKRLSGLTDAEGVYALCDLDHAPIYVGQSIDGIRTRVRRHLTSARSDVIANRQIDVWEIASVRAWPVTDRKQISEVEDALFHQFNDVSPLMNGKIPKRPLIPWTPQEPYQVVHIIPDDEIVRRRAPEVRLPRQISHYLRLVDHYLVVKDSPELQLAMDVHFERLQRYHRRFLDPTKTSS